MILTVRTLRRSALASLAIFAVACGGDDDGGGVDGGGINFIDSGPGGNIDSGQQASCPVMSDLGTIASLSEPIAGKDTQDPQPEGGPADAQLYFVLGSVGNDDFFELDLWDGYGAFAADDQRVATGTYPISGPDADVLDCGVCVFVHGNVTQGGGGVMIEKTYFATSGSITVDEFAGTTVAGSGASLSLTEIDDQGAPVVGGCTVSIPSVTFSGDIPPPM